MPEHAQAHDDNEYLTSAEVARLRRVSERTLLRERRDGAGIPYIRA